MRIKNILFLVIFSFFYSLPAYAVNLTVNLTSNYGGTVYTSTNAALGKASVTVIPKRNDIALGGSYMWVSSDGLGGYALGSYANTFGSKVNTFTVLNIATPSATINIDYNFSVVSSSGSTILTKKVTKAITIDNIDPLVLNQTKSISVDVIENLITTSTGNTTGGSGTINSTSSYGMKGFVAEKNSTYGFIKLFWLSEGLIPRDHWVVITEATEPDAPCQSGFKVGRNTTNATSFSVPFFPRAYNVSYRAKVCPIYSTTSDDPGQCATATAGFYRQCGLSILQTLTEGSSVEKLGNLQVASNFLPTAPLSTNWSGVLGESWYTASNNDRYYYVPPLSNQPLEGKLYKDVYSVNPPGGDPVQNFLANRSLDTVAVNLSHLNGYPYGRMYMDSPIGIRIPLALGSISDVLPSKELQLLNIDYMLGTSKVGAVNTSRVYNEKWLFSENKNYTNATTQVEKNKNWIFVLPNGVVYRWDGVSTGAALKGTLLGKYPEEYYDLCEESVDLFESYIQRVYGFTRFATNFWYNHAASLNASYTPQYEKWIKSRRNNAYYYILPNSNVYRWDGKYPLNPTTSVFAFTYASYFNPQIELVNFPYMP